jgi:hypothetical protein
VQDTYGLPASCLLSLYVYPVKFFKIFWNCGADMISAYADFAGVERTLLTLLADGFANSA